MKPIIKWAGGKRQLIDDIVPFIPSNASVYVEPFVGGGAVWLHLQPKRAIINDYNGELINVYNVVRESSDELIALLEEHEAADSSEHFYEVRAWDRDSSAFSRLSNVERAARIIYLNKTCYNGMFRVNSAGQLNVPYGRYKHPNIVNEPGIKALEKYLQQDIDIRCGDYAACLVDLPKGAFVYLDPPYMPVSKTANFTGYTADGFDYAEQKRLRDECVKLRDKGIAFLESNSDTPAIRELYQDFTIRTVQVRRGICADSAKRGTANEVLISM